MRFSWRFLLKPAPARRVGVWAFAGGVAALSGCAVVGNVTQLDDDYYRVVAHASPDSPPNSSTFSNARTPCFSPRVPTPPPSLTATGYGPNSA